MDCKVDWGDGNYGSTRLTTDDKGFKLSHNYKAGSYSIELYGVERDYSIAGYDNMSLISPANVNFKRVILSESVVSIEAGAFDSQYHLTSIYIPKSVTSIETYAFQGCESLTSINIPEGITTIEYGALYSCSSLTSVYIPESVTNIGPWGFGGCSPLTSINIPEKVTNIGEEAFAKCSSLKSISSFNTTAPILDDSDTDDNPVSVFDGLPANGTLHVKHGATGYDAWLSALPSGWKIVESL